MAGLTDDGVHRRQALGASRSSRATAADVHPGGAPAMVEDLKDPRRPEPSFVASERTMLEDWLEFHRVTLLLKCEGLSDEQRKQRPISTSLMSLHGLVRHMADVETGWFRRVLLEDED